VGGDKGFGVKVTDPKDNQRDMGKEEQDVKT